MLTLWNYIINQHNDCTEVVSVRTRGDENKIKTAFSYAFKLLTSHFKQACVKLHQ